MVSQGLANKHILSGLDRATAHNRVSTMNMCSKRPYSNALSKAFMTLDSLVSNAPNVCRRENTFDVAQYTKMPCIHQPHIRTQHVSNRGKGLCMGTREKGYGERGGGGNSATITAGKV
jgi:hypothetical protein